MTPVERVLERLQRVKRSGDGWTARCPAHEDRNPSLSIREGDDGRVLLNCHAGCSAEKIAAAVGLELADLFPEPPNPNGARRIVATYEYVDRDGQPLFEVVRFEPKNFRQRRRPRPEDPPGSIDGDGWVWNTRGVQRAIFHLDRVGLAIDSEDAAILVVEGERDVLALEALGFYATCNPMGAGKWRAEHAEQLRHARRAVVIPDADEVGRRHAEAVARSLLAEAAEVRVLDLAPDRDDGFDVSDWIAGARTDEEREQAKAELEQLIEQAPVYTGEEQAHDEEPPRVFAGLSHGEALARSVPPTRQIVESLIEAGTPGTVAALPETHKSFLAVEIACKTAAGGKVLGRFDVTQPGPVGYWWQDDSEANELARLQDYATRHGYTDDLPIRWHLNEGLRLPDDAPALREEIEREHQVLVVLDSFYNFVPGKVGLKDEDAALVIASIKQQVCNPTGCAVLIIDHAPWPTDTNRGPRRAYGSVFKAAAIRWGIYLEREGDKLWIEARGNNIAGLKRTLAIWDADDLELRLLDVERVAHEEYETRVLDHLEQHPGQTTKTVEETVEGRATEVRNALRRLQEAGRVTSRSSGDLGRPGTGKHWFLSNHAPPGVVPLFGTTPDHPVPPSVTNSEVVPVVPASPKGAGDGTTSGTPPPDDGTRP